MRILSWKEAQEIVDKFIPLNPYDRKAVKGSILNVVDANFVDSDPSKSQRQLYGYSIAAKRYTLYARIGKSEIEIIDPKGHGVGFLYPPKNSPKGWDKEIPQWIYEMWDYIVRDALGLKCKKPIWIDIPQMMRLNVSRIFKGAATRASCGVGPLRDFYVALLAKGMKPEMARLTLARKIAAIALTLWKKEERFDAEQLKPQAA